MSSLIDYEYFAGITMIEDEHPIAQRKVATGQR